MSGNRVVLVLAVFGLALGVPAAGSAEDCQGSLCAGWSTDSVSANVDWNGGHVDVGRRTEAFLPGGARIQTLTNSWLGISLWDTTTGENYFNCWTQLAAEELTENADGSLTLNRADPNCGGSVTWAAPGDYLPSVNSNHWGRVDPNSGSFEANLVVSQSRRTTAAGEVWGSHPDHFDRHASHIDPNPNQQWAEIRDDVGGCATNSWCGF